MSASYAEFLACKQQRAEPLGPAITADDVHPWLHCWQREVVAWAVRTGRAALWEDTGLGKTVQQIEWARLCADRSLIVAPLAVCAQTVREAAKVDVEVRYVRSGAEACGPGVWITNYEMVDHFDPARFGAVVLDEASILKQSDGKTRAKLIRHFAGVKYRLACTATPAPNDMEELTSQAEFLGVMPRNEMLAAYFINDGKMWRLKGHARGPMFQWMSTWAIALRKPSDIGGSDEGYDLPGLEILSHLLPVDVVPDDQLFATNLGGVGGRARVRRATLSARCEHAAKLVVNEPDEPWILWRKLIPEAERLASLIPDAVDVRGNWTPEQKAEAYLAFADRKIPYLIIEAGMAAYGLNFQHCARMAFVGLDDSAERYYQAIRRCYRYGQARPVRAHIVLSELEGQIAANVERKVREAAGWSAELVRAMRSTEHWRAA